MHHPPCKVTSRTFHKSRCSHLPIKWAITCEMLPSSINPLVPTFNIVDIQPSNACPRNFIIFDQTKNRSPIMFHPETESRMFYPSFGVEAPLFQDKADEKDANDEKKVASPFKEDSADIDALLSMENETEECNDDDDVMSSAQTDAMYACDSPDSCSNYEPLSKKSRPVFRKSCGSRCDDDKKQQRIRKMVKALKGIVPGAIQMSTAAVLDKAVRYLKSMRMKVQMSIGNSKE